MHGTTLTDIQFKPQGGSKCVRKYSFALCSFSSPDSTLSFHIPPGTLGSFSMFEAQDMKADIDEDDEKEFNFIPDAIITKREKIVIDTGEDDEEDKEKEELFK